MRVHEFQYHAIIFAPTASYRIAGYLLFSRRLYFARAQPILENLNLEKCYMWSRRGSVSPFVKLTFREQELNWLFAKYKRPKNYPL